MTSVASLLEEIRDLLAHRGRQAKGYMPTLDGGAETGSGAPMANFSIVSGANLVGLGPAYSGVGGTADIHHYTAGEILIDVQEHRPPGILSYGAEVQVIGQVAGQRTLLATATVNTATGTLVVPIPLGEGFSYLGVQARQLVNGVPSSATYPTVAAMAGASMVLSASGRFYR